MSRWFILSSLVLIVAVVMMWGRDHVRDWKPYQKAYRERQIERYEAEIAQAEALIDPDGLGSLESDLATAEAALIDDGQAIEELQAEVDRREGTFYGANQKFQISKAEYDESGPDIVHRKCF